MGSCGARHVHATGPLLRTALQTAARVDAVFLMRSNRSPAMPRPPASVGCHAMLAGGGARRWLRRTVPGGEEGGTTLTRPGMKLQACRIPQSSEAPTTPSVRRFAAHPWHWTALAARLHQHTSRLCVRAFRTYALRARCGGARGQRWFGAMESRQGESSGGQVSEASPSVGASSQSPVPRKVVRRPPPPP